MWCDCVSLHIMLLFSSSHSHSYFYYCSYSSFYQFIELADLYWHSHVHPSSYPLYYAMLQRSVHITVRQADFFFVWVLRWEQIRVPRHSTGNAIHPSIHGILLSMFSISYVMCDVWRVTHTCLEVSWAVWCGGHNLLHVSIPLLLLHPSLLAYFPPSYLKPSFLSLSLIIFYSTSNSLFLIWKVKYSKIGLQTRANTMELRIPLDQASNK